ncbi:MAG: GNAT family N-acetyltransferase [Roseiflexaceae bacterium]
MTYLQSLYRGHSQFNQLRRFLLDTYQQYGALRNWEPRRLEGTAFHNAPHELANVETHMRTTWVMWYDSNDHIIGALFNESSGSFYPQLHPKHLDVIPQMIHYLTSHPATSIDVWSHTDNQPLTSALEAAGFRITSNYQHQKRLNLATTQLVNPSLPDGYRIATMTTDSHAADQMGQLLNRAFHRSFHSGAEYRTFQQMAPSYRTEFDIVIHDNQGTIVANAGMTIHDAQSFVVIEPVATHPEHQRRGLARAAIIHGLIRAQKRGIGTAWIEAWHSNIAANQTYNQIGFVNVSQHYCWRYTTASTYNE